MKFRKSIIIAVIIIVTATLLIIPTYAVTYSITDLSGYNIVFNNTLSYPQALPIYYTWSIDFTSKETNTILRQFNQMTLRRNVDTNAIELIYAIYSNGSVIQSFLAYSSSSGWYSSPIKAISIQGGVSKDSPSLLSFVNYNSDTATVSYEYIDDLYTYIFGEVSSAQDEISGLNYNWSQWTQNLNIMSAIGVFARPYVPFLDIIGYPVIIMGVATSLILFLKRHTHNSSQHEKKEK